jgi:LysM repeat protein
MKTMATMFMVFFSLAFASVSFAETLEFTVKKGDSFKKLAKRFNVKQVELVMINRGKLKDQNNPDLIYPGQVFLVNIIKREDIDNGSAKAEKKQIMVISGNSTKIRHNKNIGRSDDRVESGIMLAIMIPLVLVLFYILIFKMQLKQESVEDEKNKNRNSWLTIPDYEDTMEKTDKCFIGTDSQNNIILVRKNSKMVGSMTQVARNIASSYKEDYTKMVAYVGNDVLGALYSMNSLTSIKKIELEDAIAKELYG